MQIYFRESDILERIELYKWNYVIKKMIWKKHQNYGFCPFQFNL